MTIVISGGVFVQPDAENPCSVLCKDINGKAVYAMGARGGEDMIGAITIQSDIDVHLTRMRFYGRPKRWQLIQWYKMFKRWKNASPILITEETPVLLIDKPPNSFEGCKSGIFGDGFAKYNTDYFLNPDITD